MKLKPLPLDLSEAWIWEGEEDGLVVLRPLGESSRIVSLEEHILSFFRTIEWRINKTDDPARHVGDVIEDFARNGDVSDTLTVSYCLSHSAGFAAVLFESLTPGYWSYTRPGYEDLLNYPLSMRAAKVDEVEMYMDFRPIDFLHLQGIALATCRLGQSWEKTNAAMSKFVAPLEGKRYPEGPIRKKPVTTHRCGTLLAQRLGKKGFWKKFYKGEL